MSQCTTVRHISRPGLTHLWRSCTMHNWPNGPWKMSQRTTVRHISPTYLKPNCDRPKTQIPTNVQGSSTKKKWIWTFLKMQKCPKRVFYRKTFGMQISKTPLWRRSGKNTHADPQKGLTDGFFCGFRPDKSLDIFSIVQLRVKRDVWCPDVWRNAVRIRGLHTLIR
jgi:hypothetical protein